MDNSIKNRSQREPMGGKFLKDVRICYEKDFQVLMKRRGTVPKEAASRKEEPRLLLKGRVKDVWGNVEEGLQGRHVRKRSAGGLPRCGFLKEPFDGNHGKIAL